MRTKARLKEARAIQSRFIRALNKRRKERRLTYRELGKLSGVNFATIYRALSLRYWKSSSFVVLAAIALALGFTAKETLR